MGYAAIGPEPSTASSTRLSLARCRQTLGRGHHLTDAELEALRDSLYGLANVVVDMHASQASVEKREHLHVVRFDDMIATLPPEDRESVEERAAIVEFEGQLDRDVAERAALADFIRRRQH